LRRASSIESDRCTLSSGQIARQGAMNGEPAMDSDALVAAAAIGIAACATLLGLCLATWIAGRIRSDPDPPAEPVAELAPSIAAGVAPKQLGALADELSAHARSAAAQADRARAALDAARVALSAAEAARSGAEAAYDAARAAHTDAVREVRVAPPDALAEARERDVSRAALDAYRRGELPVEVLRTVFGHPDPDPARDARERAADRLAMAESQARRAFQQAVAAARVAREELHVAEVGDAAVRREAADAAREAHEVALAVRARLPRRRQRRR
jgi:hypothetical protein